MPKWLSQFNHFHFDAIVKDIERLGPIRFTWEGSMHGEKIIQSAKKEFVIKKGNFCGILTRKNALKDAKMFELKQWKWWRWQTWLEKLKT